MICVDQRETQHKYIYTLDCQYAICLYYLPQEFDANIGKNLIKNLPSLKLNAQTRIYCQGYLKSTLIFLYYIQIEILF